MIPGATAAGPAVLEARRPDGTTASLNITLASVAPGIFTANSDGRGVPAALAVRVAADNTQTISPVYRLDPATGRFVAAPIDLGAAAERVYLTLFGTGLRNYRNLSSVAVTVGGEGAPVVSAGAQPQFVGLDQVNVGPLPRALAGRGEVVITLTVEGTRANDVSVSFR